MGGNNNHYLHRDSNSGSSPRAADLESSRPTAAPNALKGISNRQEKPKLISYNSQQFHLHLAFFAISFGYMLPWTALGSLIAYYKYTYSASFYVKIYCAYYLPGLPVALLQYQFDEMLDVRFGSQSMYMARGVACFTVMTVTLLVMTRITNESSLLLMFMVLGVCGWMCHGTASMLAAMYPREVIAYLQIGFCAPQIYTLFVDAALHLGRHATRGHLLTFFDLTAVVVLLALTCWVMVVGSESSRKYFLEKDKIFSLQEYTKQLQWEGVRCGQFGNEKRDHRDLADRRSIDTSNSSKEELLKSTSGGSSNSERDSSRGDEHPHIRHLRPVATPVVTGLSISSQRMKHHQPLSSPSFAASGMVVTSENNNNSAHIEMHGPRHMVPANRRRKLFIAIIVLMWASIFQAAFFAYVESPNGWSIEQILYFVRLFSDLLGRPLTFLPRPALLQTDTQLMNAALIRMLVLSVFFSYTFLPFFPRSDYFIICFVAVYSMASGYLSILIYEYAANESKTRAERAQATNLLNTGFQIAAFIAVVMSSSLTSSGLIEYLQVDSYQSLK